MSRVASAALVQSLDGSGLYTPQRNLAIFEQVPPELRLTEFSPRTLPDHPAFHWQLVGRAKWRGFDLGPLPEPMQRDFAYCLWRVIDSGLTITAPYALLVNWFARLVEETRGAGRPPLRSLIDCSVSDWEHELVRERARRTGKLGWPQFGPGIFRRCYRHLMIAYDPASGGSTTPGAHALTRGSRCATTSRPRRAPATTSRSSSSTGCARR